MSGTDHLQLLLSRSQISLAALSTPGIHTRHTRCKPPTCTYLLVALFCPACLVDGAGHRQSLFDTTRPTKHAWERGISGCTPRAALQKAAKKHFLLPQSLLADVPRRCREESTFMKAQTPAHRDSLRQQREASVHPLRVSQQAHRHMWFGLSANQRATPLQVGFFFFFFFLAWTALCWFLARSFRLPAASCTCCYHSRDYLGVRWCRMLGFDLIHLSLRRPVAVLSRELSHWQALYQSSLMHLCCELRAASRDLIRTPVTIPYVRARRRSAVMGKRPAASLRLTHFSHHNIRTVFAMLEADVHHDASDPRPRWSPLAAVPLTSCSLELTDQQAPPNRLV